MGHPILPLCCYEGSKKRVSWHASRNGHLSPLTLFELSFQVLYRVLYKKFHRVKPLSVLSAELLG